MAQAPVLLVANADPVHVGAHLLEAAGAIGVAVVLCDTRDADRGPSWRRRWNWWARGHRPVRLRAFGASVIETAQAARAETVLATGLAPLDRQTLVTLGQHGVRRKNFLTDDPWNRAHHAPWFLEALREYDDVFTPRRANMNDLRALQGPSVTYVPFAFAPSVHFREPPADDRERQRFAADLMFAGGADPDRVRAVTPFIAAGFQVALYGGYWDRFPATRASARGFLSGTELRHAVSGAAVSLCLVRRANRDGHAMRTFELAAMGGCVLAEDTPEHREILGPDGDAVSYFRDAQHGLSALAALLRDASARQAMAVRLAQRIGRDEHTYAARLRVMLNPGAREVRA